MKKIITKTSLLFLLLLSVLESSAQQSCAKKERISKNLLGFHSTNNSATGGRIYITNLANTNGWIGTGETSNTTYQIATTTTSATNPSIYLDPNLDNPQFLQLSYALTNANPKNLGALAEIRFAMNDGQAANQPPGTSGCTNPTLCDWGTAAYLEISYGGVVYARVISDPRRSEYTDTMSNASITFLNGASGSYVSNIIVTPATAPELNILPATGNAAVNGVLNFKYPKPDLPSHNRQWPPTYMIRLTVNLPTSISNTGALTLKVTEAPVAQQVNSFLTGAMDDYILYYASLKACYPTISGTLVNDINNSNAILDGLETGTNANTSIYAYLVSAGGVIVDTCTIGANGNYTFYNTEIGATYSVELSNQIYAMGTSGVVANTISNNPPSGWVLTGEGINNTDDANVNGTTAVTINSADITGVNFGIQRLPESAVFTTATQINPGGTTSIPVPGTNPFATSTTPATNPNTSDYDGGTVNNIRITNFPTNTNTITIGSTTYVNGGTCPAGLSCVTWPASGVTTSYNNGSPAITFDPNSNVTNVVINFAAIDNAGFEDPSPGSVTIPLTTIGISGKVMNDTNGLVDLIVNGNPIGNPASTTLYAYLVDSVTNKIVNVSTLQTNGNYSFDEVAPNTKYNIVISTTIANIGANKPTVTLPNNWVNTGEHNALTAGNDGNPNGEQMIAVATSNVSNVNFGIERLPTADAKLFQLSSTPVVNTIINLNAGGNLNTGAIPGNLTGTDPEDGILNSLSLNNYGIKINSLPTFGKLLYGGLPVTQGQTILNYNPNNLQFQFQGNPVPYNSTTFTYSVLDAAQKASIPVNYTIQWTEPLPITLINFDAEQQDKAVILTWVTAKEINNTGFNIEHSSDAINWTSLSFLSTKALNGNSNSILNYVYTHTNPKKGLNMYRLEQLDTDGKSTFSRVLTVAYNNSIPFRIIPNPTTDAFTVEGVQWGDKIHVYDATGKLLKDIIVNKDFVNINTSQLHAGYYQVIVYTVSGNIEVLKLIITR